MSRTPSLASHTASGTAYAMTPAKPGWPRTRSRRARHRTDFEATRTGSPPARRTRSSALASKASRSTATRGAGRPAGAPVVDGERARLHDLGGDVCEFAVRVLAGDAQHIERLFAGEPVVLHEDAHGHPDLTVAPQSLGQGPGTMRRQGLGKRQTTMGREDQGHPHRRPVEGVV